jgi:ornithine cyclodeaminase/alanine dehydrogenase-like protein (mu-crystallin family)
MVRFITEDEVKRLLPMRIAIECVERAFRDRALGHAVDVPRERTKTALGHLHILQAASTTLNVIGFKAYFVGRTARSFLVHIIELDSGRLLGMIQADEMGIRRTGAATAVATRVLAREDAAIVACFGSGRHAVTQLEAVSQVRRIRQARVHGRTPERLANFKTIVERDLEIEVVIAASANEALAGADIINIVTRSENPLFAGELLSPGQHINAVGSNALNRRELDLAAIRRTDVIVVDSVEVAQRECGDLLPAVEAGLLHWNNIPDLGRVLLGREPGRSSPHQITLFESQGMGIEDIYVGKHVLDEALKRGIGIDLPIS